MENYAALGYLLSQSKKQHKISTKDLLKVFTSMA